MEEGLLIALEGIDGSGHSTQARLLREVLEKNYTLSNEDEPIAIINREPTDGPIGGEIRECLSGRLEVDSETLALMFAADRRDHVENELMDLVRSGKIVILDRYILSSLAYQGVEVQDDEWLISINSKSPSPDLTLLLDVSTSVAMERMQRDRVRTEIFENQSKLKNVRDKYLELAEKFQAKGEDIYVINGNRPKEQVKEEIKNIVYQKIEGNSDHKFKNRYKKLFEYNK